MICLNSAGSLVQPEVKILSHISPCQPRLGTLGVGQSRAAANRSFEHFGRPAPVGRARGRSLEPQAHGDRVSPCYPEQSLAAEGTRNQHRATPGCRHLCPMTSTPFPRPRISSRLGSRSATGRDEVAAEAA